MMFIDYVIKPIMKVFGYDTFTHWERLYLFLWIQYIPARKRVTKYMLALHNDLTNRRRNRDSK